MKIAAFSVRPDEKQYFDTFANVYKVELQINRSGFTADDIESVKGCEAMSVCDGMCDLSAPVLEKLAAEGVKYIGFRTIGYNSVDLEAAKRLGIRVAHSGYSPYSVANYTVMLIAYVYPQGFVCNDAFAHSGLFTWSYMWTRNAEYDSRYYRNRKNWKGSN